jgi:hypothetical protein
MAKMIKIHSVVPGIPIKKVRFIKPLLFTPSKSSPKTLPTVPGLVPVPVHEPVHASTPGNAIEIVDLSKKYVLRDGSVIEYPSYSTVSGDIALREFERIYGFAMDDIVTPMFDNVIVPGFKRGSELTEQLIKKILIKSDTEIADLCYAEQWWWSITWGKYKSDAFSHCQSRWRTWNSTLLYAVYPAIYSTTTGFIAGVLAFIYAGLKLKDMLAKQIQELDEIIYQLNEEKNTDLTNIEATRKENIEKLHSDNPHPNSTWDWVKSKVSKMTTDQKKVLNDYNLLILQKKIYHLIK